SRRRHTRWPRDWSSDVCSSDLFVVTSSWSLRQATRCDDSHFVVRRVAPCSSLTTSRPGTAVPGSGIDSRTASFARIARTEAPARSEEHTSELQSRGHLVCRLLL